jgi:DNA-binding CsgD family transcriptional regulator
MVAPALSKALAADRDVLKGALNALHQPALLVEHPSREIHGANPEMEPALGYRPEELVGRLTDMLHVDSKLFDLFGRAGASEITANKPFTTHGWLRHRDGRILASHHWVTPVRAACGRLLNFSLIKVREAPECADLLRAMQRLTEREAEVLRSCLKGESAKEAALAMGISHRTVETHRARIQDKFDVRSIGELLARFIRREMLP